MSKYVTAIILAGGKGERMNASSAKQNIEILGESVLDRAVSAFSSCDVIDSIIVVLRSEDVVSQSEALHRKFGKVAAVVAGGDSRAESAKNGFSAIPRNTDYVAIHDAARCLITPKDIERVVFAAFEHQAATAAASITDTVKLVDLDGFISETVPRSGLYKAQTPQVFSALKYREALSHFNGNFAEITDDNLLMEREGNSIFVVDLGSENIKITTQADLLYAEFLLSKRSSK